jgi:hypothetical protein
MTTNLGSSFAATITKNKTSALSGEASYKDDKFKPKVRIFKGGNRVWCWNSRGYPAKCGQRWKLRISVSAFR